MDEDLKKLSEMLKTPVKSITKQGAMTLVELENGVKIPLMGGMVELTGLKVPECNFCGKGADECFLFSPDDKNYICKECTIIALETFAQNGETIDLNLSKIAPELAERIIAQRNEEG